MESNLYQILTAMTLIAWLFFIWRFNTSVGKYVLIGAIVVNTLVYLYAIFASLTELQGSLIDLKGYKLALMNSDKALLAGWLHYLVVDPILGLWVVANRKVDRALNIRLILLVCIFMAPLGLLLHFVVPQKPKTIF